MTERNKISRTISPSGVFRQPREDILQESVSQCLVNQDSLCKVSDFEISMHSKYNLPNLYNVDGKGRAVYWLYKHSLADSESVRNCKIKTGEATETSLLSSTDTNLNESIISENKRRKLIGKDPKLNKNLFKLRELFLTSATSDIEIKETYNSYVNLTDLEAVDLLLKRNENLSVDKYRNLMMNLELRRKMLKRKQLEKHKEFISKTAGDKANEVISSNYTIEKYFSRNRDASRFKRRREKSHSTNSNSLKSSNSNAGSMMSGLEINNLDHILNQMRFFLESGKCDEITKAQKRELENHLRTLTSECTRSELKKHINKDSLRRKLNDSIRTSLRDVIYPKEKTKTSSLVVEMDSASDACNGFSKKTAKLLKECRAQSNISNPDQEKLSSSDHSIHDLVKRLSKEELECQKPEYTSRLADVIQTDSTDRLIFKKYRLDENDDLLDFSGPKRPFGFKRKLKPKEKEAANMDKFSCIKRFNEADTFKSLQVKHKEKNFKYSVKYIPEESNHNVCINQPVMSYNGELDKMNECEVKGQTDKEVEKWVKEKVSSETGKSKSVEGKYAKMKMLSENLIFKDAKKLQKSTSMLSNTSNESNDSDYKHRKEKIKSSSNAVDTEEKNRKGKKKLRRTTSTSSNKSNRSNEEDFKSSRKTKTTTKALGAKELDKKKLRRTISTASNKSNRSTEDENKIYQKERRSDLIDVEKAHTTNYACFKDCQPVSSDSGNDNDNLGKHKKASRSKSPMNKSLRSNSFPKAKRTLPEKHPSEIANKDAKPRNEIQLRQKRKQGRIKNEEKKFTQSDNSIESSAVKPKQRFNKHETPLNENNVAVKVTVKQHSKTDSKRSGNNIESHLYINDTDKNTVKITSFCKKLENFEESDLQTGFLSQNSAVGMKKASKPMSHRVATLGKSIEALTPPSLVHRRNNVNTSSPLIEIDESLVNVNEKNILENKRHMESSLKNTMLSNLHKSVCEENIEGSVNIPIYKKGYEIARITRQSPSCAYTLKTYAQKVNKSTQMFEHVTRNDLYTLQWIHDNLFQININPHTLIVDEKIKEVSEISDVS